MDVAGQVCPSMVFPRQEYWSKLPFLSPGDLPNPGTEPLSPGSAGGFFTTVPVGKPIFRYVSVFPFSLRELRNTGIHGSDICCHQVVELV